MGPSRRSPTATSAKVRVDHRRVFPDLSCGAFEGDTAAVENIGAVGESQGLRGHLLDEQHCHALRSQTPDGGKDLEDEDGRRYWVFRDGLYQESELAPPGWYLHGVFG